MLLLYLTSMPPRRSGSGEMKVDLRKMVDTRQRLKSSRQPNNFRARGVRVSSEELVDGRGFIRKHQSSCRHKHSS